MTGSSRKLVYEGEVYVRPVGRGIVLEDAPGRRHLDEWVEDWLMERHPDHPTGNYSDRLRIVVEAVADASGDRSARRDEDR